MKLAYSHQQIASVLGTSSACKLPISSVAFDSRKIINGKEVLFFALQGVFRNGHDFIDDAYNKGVRHFVVTKSGATKHLDNTHEILVLDVLSSLQELAQFHRSQYNCEVIAITGSNGKTTVKEWLSMLLSKQFNVSKSPKSYNSKLGIALSLLEINSDTDIAIIEVGIDKEGEMKKQIPIIQPTKGILTSFGTGHRSLFKDKASHFREKISIFQNLSEFIFPSKIEVEKTENGRKIEPNEYLNLLSEFRHSDTVSIQNAQLCIAMAIQLGLSEEHILNGVPELNSLALRMETYNGVNGNKIINDTYNVDLDSLHHSLEYQLAASKNNDRVVIIGLTEKERNKEEEIRNLVNQFQPINLIVHYPGKKIDIDFYNKSILIKGTRRSKMENIAKELRKINHQTYIEIDLKCIRHNINHVKSLLKPSTKLLCMVKASSYGADAKTMGTFLEKMGVDYLGVAYPEEGIALRESGIKCPILVMNCEESTFTSIIEHELEPAIFSLTQLNTFITELIYQSKENYPIHVKLETGMNRLGFQKEDIAPLINLIKSQPEIYIKSIYSHLADADNSNRKYTQQQIKKFEAMSNLIVKKFSYNITRHILNSAGILNHTNAQFDMVRLGIGMYGVLNDSSLRSSIKWFSTISQVRLLKKGDSVGYGRSFTAEKELKIAIIPVGYADGFRRSLGQGVGGVFIKKTYCPTIGNVCMDMIMVNVSHLDATPGDVVEIIGKQQSMLNFANKLNTIPYEVMTSFSTRMHRMFVDQ